MQESFDPTTRGHLDVIRRAINTVFSVAPPEFQFISSTIRELASYQSPEVRTYVVPCVASALLEAN